MSLADVIEERFMLRWEMLRRNKAKLYKEELLNAAFVYRSLAHLTGNKESAMESVCRHSGLIPSCVFDWLQKLEAKEAREVAQQKKEQKRRELIWQKQQAKKEKERMKQEQQQKKEAEKVKQQKAKEKLIGQQPVTLQLNGATITGTASAIAIILAKLESKK